MTYEKSRQEFQEFKQTYDSRKAVVDMRRGNMELYQKRENVMEDKLHDNRADLAKLKAMEKNLALQQDRIVELESRERVQLKQLETVTLKARSINLVKGQKLAEISKKQAEQKKQAGDKKKHAVHPLLSQISDGIVVPSDVATKGGCVFLFVCPNWKSISACVCACVCVCRKTISACVFVCVCVCVCICTCT
jgi:hypothetical protein